MAAKPKIDYDRIEPDWIAGIKTVRQLAEEYTKATGISCSHTVIRKHFKNKGIERNLAAKIKAKAEAKVSKSMVSGNVSTETIIEANAEYIANIDISHRKDIRRLSGVEDKLLQEFENIADDPDLFKDIGEIMRNPDANGNDKLNDLYRKVVSMPGRVDSFKKLTDTMKTRIELERKVVKLDDQQTNVERIEDVIARINAAG